MSGVITKQPPAIRQLIPTLVPRVNADGNETAGVASVLHQAPLGTYLGWNVQASGFFAGQICGFTGGYVPFARTRAERLSAGDPRLSIEERHGSATAYAAKVKDAIDGLIAKRFMLREDAESTLSRLIAVARASGLVN